MRRIAFALLMTAAACRSGGVSVVVPPPDARQTSALTPAYPLKVGPTNRYLVDQNGAPFLWTGDAAWSLIAQPTLADAEIYLDDRKSRGFNITLVNLIEHKFADHAPANHDGVAPFTGRPFATPNTPYFQHVDEVINQAAARGINVLLDALYLGYECADQGWCKEVSQATPEEMQAWGKFLGQRYSSFDNIIWVIGGDTDPSPVRSNVLAFVNSLITYDNRHLVTTHQDEETTSVSIWPNQSWVKINNVYSDKTTIYVECQDAYKVSPVIPYFLMETDYENEHGLNAQQMRAEIYWPVLSGAMGVNFGNCPIWNFNAVASTIDCGTADWKANLGNVGSENMRYLHRLLASRPWHTLVPDLAHTALSAGYGSDVHFAAAARASDGATLIAYLPDSRQVTVDMSQISGGTHGQANAFWYAPGNGAVTSIGTFSTSGTQRFTPPSGGDWVLVVDDASRGYPMPGMVVATSAPPTLVRPATATGPGTGDTSDLAVLGTDDGGEAALSYTWRASAAPAGASVAFAPNGNNAAKNSVATFSTAGTYMLTATIADGEGQTATSTVSVTITSAPRPVPATTGRLNAALAALLVLFGAGALGVLRTRS